MALERSYNSASGADINVIINGKVVGELQGISYSVSREKAPIYTMGSPDPRSFARGKRGVAGTLIFATFDRTAILDYFPSKEVFVNKYDVRYAYEGNTDFTNHTDNTTLDNVGSEQVGSLGDPVTKTDVKQAETAWYPDQIMPFEVYISAENEYGSIMKKAIVGVELLNEGGGVSVDDLMLAEQYTYVATGIVPWTAVGSGAKKFNS